MHILLIPSWYVTPKNPIRGSFFRDQAQALQKMGHKVGMLVPPTKLRSFHGLAEVRQHWQRRNTDIEITDDHGVLIYRIPWWGWRESLTPWERGKLALQIFDRYCAQNGTPDILHGHSTIYGGYLAAYIGLQRGLPAILTEHSTNFQDGFILPGQGAITRYTLRHTKRQFAVGYNLAEALNTYAPEKNIEVISNVVDVDWFTLPQMPVADSPFVFLMVASLTRRKGHHILLPAFAQACKGQDVKLRIIGSGYHGRKLAQLNDLIAKLGIQAQVEVHGLVPKEQLLEYFQTSHALVSSSYTEGFGVTLIEAMACGKPVIATRSGGPEHFVNEQTGILIQPGNINDLAYALRQMCSEYQRFDPQVIRTYCVNNFSEDVITRQLQSVYEGIVNHD